MKKILAFITAVAASVAIASADIILLPHVYGGLGLGTTEGKDAKDFMETTATSWLLGAGLGLNIPFGGYFGIQPGVDFYYNTINAEAKVGSADGSASYASLDIPLIFTVKYNKFNFGIGPYLSIPVGKLSYDGDLFKDEGVSWKDRDIATAVNFGLSFEAGYEERLGLGRCLIFVRYMLDFLPTEIEGAAGEDDAKIFTRRGLLLDLGYKLPLSF